MTTFKRGWNLAATLLLCSPALGELGATVVVSLVIGSAWFAVFRGVDWFTRHCHYQATGKRI